MECVVHKERLSRRKIPLADRFRTAIVKFRIIKIISHFGKMRWNSLTINFPGDLKIAFAIEPVLQSFVIAIHNVVQILFDQPLDLSVSSEGLHLPFGSAADGHDRMITVPCPSHRPCCCDDHRENPKGLSHNDTLFSYSFILRLNDYLSSIDCFKAFSV